MEGSSPKYGGWEGFPETGEGCVRADKVSRNRWLFRQGWKARWGCLGHAAEEEGSTGPTCLEQEMIRSRVGMWLGWLFEGHVKNS